MRVAFAASAGVVVDRGGPVAAVTAVIGEGHQGLVGAAVDRVPKSDCAMLAGFLGDRGDAGLGSQLRAVAGSFEHGADLADDLTEVDAADTGQAGCA